MPEPDLPSISITSSEVDSIIENYNLHKRMNMLPERVEQTLLDKYKENAKSNAGLPQSCAKILSHDGNLRQLFEDVMTRLSDKHDSKAPNEVSAKRAAQWLTGPFIGAWRQAGDVKDGSSDNYFPTHVHIEQADLLAHMARGSVTDRVAKMTVLPMLLQEKYNRSALDIDYIIGDILVDTKDKSESSKLDTDELKLLCEDIVGNHQREVEEYLSGAPLWNSCTIAVLHV